MKIYIYCENNVESRCATLLETYPERLTAVIVAKSYSKMYSGVWLIMHMRYFCISLCHYWIMCVDRWIIIESMLNSGCNKMWNKSKGMNTFWRHSSDESRHTCGGLRAKRCALHSPSLRVVIIVCTLQKFSWGLIFGMSHGLINML